MDVLFLLVDEQTKTKCLHTSKNNYEIYEDHLIEKVGNKHFSYELKREISFDVKVENIDLYSWHNSYEMLYPHHMRILLNAEYGNNILYKGSSENVIDVGYLYSKIGTIDLNSNTDFSKIVKSNIFDANIIYVSRYEIFNCYAKYKHMEPTLVFKIYFAVDIQKLKDFLDESKIN